MQLNSIPIPSVRLSIEAYNQSGKTAFMLTAPKPYVHFAFDLGWQRALMGGRYELLKDFDFEVVDLDLGAEFDRANPPWKGHDITILLVPKPIYTDEILIKGAREHWQYYNSRLAAAIAAPASEVACIGVDTGSMCRELRADAYLQELQQKVRPGEQVRQRLSQIEYAKPNEAIRDLYNYCEIAGKNLIVSHHLQDERKLQPVTNPRDNTVSMQNLPTGDHVLRGLGDTLNLVDVAMRFKGHVRGGKFDVTATFQKSGYVPELLGSNLMNPTWNGIMTWLELKSGGRLKFPMAQVKAVEPEPVAGEEVEAEAKPVIVGVEEV